MLRHRLFLFLPNLVLCAMAAASGAGHGGSLPSTPPGGGIANDDCETAQPINCGTTVQGTTVGALPDSPPDCGTDITAPGVWYSFLGNGGTVVLSTCSDPGYDTKINVYTGVCDDLTCIGGNDDGPNGCFPGSELTFGTEDGVTYLVLVQGYNGDQGTFNLELDCPTCIVPAGITVSPGDTVAYVFWTSGNSGSNYLIELGPPGFTPGTGTLLTGSVGVDGPPVALPGLTASTGYELYITESCGVGDLSEAAGPIAFTTQADPLAANAFCAGALPIACGGTVSGNTQAGIYSPGPWCASANITTNGLWYTFTGDGSAVTLSTCGTAAFDSKISVFTGGCGALACAGGNDDDPGCTGNTSSVTIPTADGTSYLVLVHGYDQDAGAFTMSMTCAEPCAPQVPNDACASATALVPQAPGACVPITGTNVCAYTAVQANPPCDPYAPIQDVWYVLNTGPSTDHTITVASITAVGLRVALYTDCGVGFINCFDPAQGPIVLNGLTPNTEYYVQVWNGGGADAGTFTICDEAPVLQSVREDMAGVLRVWPVPAEGMLHVEGLTIGTLVMLADAQGRVVLTRRVERGVVQQFDVADLAPGLYVLRQAGAEPRSVPVVLR